MEALLKSAKEREQEFERRQERIAQREREAEGDMFKDKEKFVTAAFRKKMEEIAEQEKEQARIDAMEAALDVTKSGMGGFYRHLYRQTFGEEKGQKPEVKVEETEEEKAAKVKEELKKISVETEDTPVDEAEVAAAAPMKKINRN